MVKCIIHIRYAFFTYYTYYTHIFWKFECRYRMINRLIQPVTSHWWADSTFYMQKSLLNPVCCSTALSRQLKPRLPVFRHLTPLYQSGWLSGGSWWDIKFIVANTCDWIAFHIFPAIFFSWQYITRSCNVCLQCLVHTLAD